MTWTVDARVPVRFGAVADAGEDDALLMEGDGETAGRPVARFDPATATHPAECTCCAPGSPVAGALNSLFQARATGKVPFFRRILAVTATPEGDMAVWTALRADPLVSGRFTLVGDDA